MDIGSYSRRMLYGLVALSSLQVSTVLAQDKAQAPSSYNLEQVMLEIEAHKRALSTAAHPSD